MIGRSLRMKCSIMALFNDKQAANWSESAARQFLSAHLLTVQRFD